MDQIVLLLLMGGGLKSQTECPLQKCSQRKMSNQAKVVSSHVKVELSLQIGSK